MTRGNRVGVFTKPWRLEPIAVLADRLAAMGFDAAEPAVRDGYQVTPDTVRRDLPAAVRRFEMSGIEVHSVASEPTDRVFAGCADAGVGMIRIQVPVDIARGYFAAKEAFRRRLDELVGLYDRYHVTIGVQIHSGRFLARSTEVMETIGDYDPRRVAVVWDCGHAAVCGEEPEYGLSTCGRHLSLVNFKNFRYERGDDGFHPTPCAALDGIASWSEVVAALVRRRYAGACCISAQYAPGSDVEELARSDCSYLRGLLGA